MRSFDRTNRISKLLDSFVRVVKIRSALNYTDLNREAQNVLAVLLSKVFHCSHLRNLDVTEQQDYPGIDLADDDARIAVQVTSNEKPSKVRDTLGKFANHKMYKKYDRLIVYILTEKQKRYEVDFSNLVPAPFKFDKKRDILDYTDLLPHIKALSLDKQQQILDLLEDEFGIEGWQNYVLPPEAVKKHEEVYVRPVQFENALSILRREGIVILVGPPHIGKTEAGIELLLGLSVEKQYSSVLRLEEFNNWKRLIGIRQRAILLDDAFGKLNFDNTIYGNRFDELRTLASENLIIITSRRDIFETALKQTRMGETKKARELTVELTPSSAYDINALRQVLEKHVYYARTYSTRTGKSLSQEEANILLSAWQLIVQHLRFPHNIEWLVSDASGKLIKHANLLSLIEDAKHIEAAVEQWYERQEESLRIFAAVIALHPYMPTIVIQEAYRLACIKRDISIDDVERKARQSAGYIRVDARISFAHPSYEEGINKALKTESSYIINDLLEARAETLLSKPILSLLQYRRENNDLKEDEYLFRHSPSSQAITFKQWFGDYIHAYNHIISRDFPNMRTAFYPNWNGTSRIYAFVTPEGEMDCWAHLQQVDNEAEVTIDQASPTLQMETRTDIEQGAWQTHTGPSVVWHHYPSSTRSVPQIDALNEVIKQIASPLQPSSFRRQVFLNESWHLRMARLLIALESANFPLQSISVSNPLTVTRLEEWANPYFQEPFPIHLLPRNFSMGISLSHASRKINDLDIPLALEEINMLEAEGHQVTGKLLVPPDLTIDNYLQYPDGTTHSDFYTDDRLVEAITYGMRIHYEAYKITVERSFSTLYDRMFLYNYFPIKIVCVVERNMPNYWNRPNVSYAMYSLDDTQTDEVIKVQVHLISERVSSQKCEEAFRIRESFWSNTDSGLFLSGNIGVGTFLHLEKWYKDVIQSITDDFKNLLRGEG